MSEFLRRIITLELCQRYFYILILSYSRRIIIRFQIPDLSIERAASFLI